MILDVHINLPFQIWICHQMSRVETGKGVGHFFLGALPLTVNFNAFYWLCPSLSFMADDCTRSSGEGTWSSLCLCDKMLAEGQYKKFKGFHFLSGKFHSFNPHISLLPPPPRSHFNSPSLACTPSGLKSWFSKFAWGGLSNWKPRCAEQTGVSTCINSFKEEKSKIQSSPVTTCSDSLVPWQGHV